MAKKTIDAKFTPGVAFMLKRVPIKWAALQSPDTAYEHKWKVNAILTSVQAEELKSAGFNIKIDKDGDSFLEVSSKVTKVDGSKNNPPRVVGSDGKTPFTQEPGNGSICNIQVFAKTWDKSGNNGIKSYLNGVQVVEHIPYAGGASFDDESGDSGVMGSVDDVPF